MALTNPNIRIIICITWGLFTIYTVITYIQISESETAYKIKRAYWKLSDSFKNRHKNSKNKDKKGEDCQHKRQSFYVFR